MSDAYQVVAATSELPSGAQMHVNLDGTDILLVNNDGSYHAVSYYCSHEELPLEGGEMRSGCITCPYHGAEFSLADGSVQAPPAFEPLRCYPVRVENDVIAVLVEADS